MKTVLIVVLIVPGCISNTQFKAQGTYDSMETCKQALETVKMDVKEGAGVKFCAYAE